ncbi:RpiR family transcriptional regulator [Nonomuraea fuscirosea]|uniref:RpiR family transcriptional regulator n=1 Tax=Nonomuraea fuscirosea TaxID=1291556 RepID=A0A2T0N2V2_9ACTN|nr:MurR/RpiR family transcriptional regulator [Nonomuraea fuscirosea]PRX66275.1 RpiR family transcriptional regulator [Nonomuraea fuscirosea]
MENDPIAGRLSAVYPELPPGERAVVRVLLDDYPFAALGSLRALAERAGVSPPTASRLFDRLGYGGFADFQAAVRDGARDRSRLLEFVTRRAPANDQAGDPSGDQAGAVSGAALDHTRPEPTPPPPAGEAGASSWRQAAENLRAGLDGTLTAVPEPLYHRAAALLAEAGSVWALGGPLSELAADYLIRQLAGLRPRAERVPGSAPGRARTVLDLTASDVIVAYDFRRYSPGTARFVHAARARGARLVLVTDAWGSPLAAEAEVLIRLPREAAGPIAPLAHEIAVTELLLVATAAHLAPAGRAADRLAALDDLTQTL